MNVEPNSFQDKLLTAILEQYPSKNEGIEALSELLQVGTDPIYKRLRGETMLNAHEVALLARHFKISLDQLVFEDTSLSLFDFNPQKAETASIDSFLSNIYEKTEMVAALPNSYVYYASADIPFLYIMGIPELISFKFYVWGTTIWNLDYMQETPFSFDLIPQESIEKSLKINEIYNSFPTTELWGLSSFDNIINQIEYFVNCQGFKNPEDPLLIMDKLQELIQRISVMAEFGIKDNSRSQNNSAGQFNLYQNELLYSNTLIYIDSDSVQTVMASFGDPYFLTTLDKKICYLTKDWFQNLIQKSNSLSNQAERNRKSFFYQLEKLVANSKKRIEVLLDEWG